MAGENAMMKSSLCLIRDCCATSVCTVSTKILSGDRWTSCLVPFARYTKLRRLELDESFSR